MQRSVHLGLRSLWLPQIICVAEFASATDTGTLLLASASQDKNIRIWAIVPEELAGSSHTTPATFDPEQPMLPGAISRCCCSDHVRRIHLA